MKNIKERKYIAERIVEKYCDPPSVPLINMRERPCNTVNYSGIGEEEMRRRDEYYMSCAIELACAALEWGEVPVGALIVKGGEIISAEFNGRETMKDALYHAECAAVHSACVSLGGWRLPGCELYVTLEPCIMCAGAIISARIPRVVFGCTDIKAGAFGGIFNVNSVGLNHKPKIVSGILADEASSLLREFFSSRR